MPDSPDDAALLAGYARTRSRQAIGELARRHTAFVYSAARRQVGDSHLAEDITQAVFLLLLQKAPSIQNPAKFVGWLFNTTRYIARNAMKLQKRRNRHEQFAATEKSIEASDPLEPRECDEISPLLDQALARLGERDRQSILLRYFNGLSIPEVARAMAASEVATRKRLVRGLERLRRLLAKNGAAVSAIALAASLSARSSHAAPPNLHSSIQSVISGKSAASKTALALAHHPAPAILSTPGVVGLAACILVALGVWPLLRAQHSTLANAQTPARADQPPPAPPPPVAAPTNPGSPSIALVTLPGAVTGSPLAVDLDGTGKLAIVVPYMGMRDPNTNQPVQGPPGITTDPSAFVGAFHLDGTPLPGWPVLIHRADPHDDDPTWWHSTPLIAPDGPHNQIVLAKPNGPDKRDKGVAVIQPDGTLQTLPTTWALPDPGTSFTFADPRGDGKFILFGGGTSCTIAGAPFSGWRGLRAPSGFSASAADVAGDGKPRFFMVTQRHKSSNAVVVAYDSTGHSFGDWPQKIGFKSFAAPSLGKVFADGKMQVILSDFRGHILAWTWDGKPFGPSFAEKEGHSADDTQLSPDDAMHERCLSIFKDNIVCEGPASLADLDGDGLAEIIVCDRRTSTLRAWHGDGTGFANPDGIIAHLGSADLFGVSVAGPDETGAFDFFAGAWWVHRNKDGSVQTRLMVPTVPQTPLSTAVADAAGPAPDAIATQCQDTIADLYGDGMAEVLIGTADGRVYIFQPGLKYSSQWAQWPMYGHDLQHSNCWTPAAK